MRQENPRYIAKDATDMGPRCAEIDCRSLAEYKRPNGWPLCEEHDHLWLEEELAFIRWVAAQYGAGTELWNAVAHAERCERDGTRAEYERESGTA